MERIYLDNNATTRVDPRVVEAMLPFFTEQFGNPSSQHGFGVVAAAAVRDARQRLQALLGAASEQEIVFSASGSEADNTAILSALAAQEGRDEIITTTVEHPAILALCLRLRKERGVTVHLVPVDGRGRLDREAFRRALGSRTAVVSVMWANNETGTLFPVAELADLAHAAGALFHTDAVQAVGKVPMELKSTAIDMLSLSGHKLHAPKGIGALYVRSGVRLRPLVVGGYQERGQRAGTENVPAIVGLGRAAELALAHLNEENSRVRGLRDRLERGTLERIEGTRVLGDTSHRLPNTASIAFEHVEAEALLSWLDRAGIACSAGSACASGSVEPSHVLRAMQVPYAAARGAIRFSLSRDSTPGDVDRVLELLPGIVRDLRGPSPFVRRTDGRIVQLPA